jgi:hypothetical protein
MWSDFEKITQATRRRRPGFGRNALVGAASLRAAAIDTATEFSTGGRFAH